MIYLAAILLPILISTALYFSGLEMNTYEFLTLTLQVVWGVMVSLGGGIIFLTKFKFKESNSKHIFRQKVTDNVRWLCFPLIIQTLIFIFIAIFYPLRHFVSRLFGLSSENYKVLAVLSDSLLVGLISTPSIFSILIGLWCIYLSVYHDAKAELLKASAESKP